MIGKTLAVLAFLVGAVTVTGCAKSDDAGDADPSTAGADLSSASGSKCHGKTGTKDCSSQANRAKAISREVFAMKDVLTSGNHDFARGKPNQSADPIDLVKMFIKHNNSDDPDALKGYKFDSALKDFPSDQQIAGTFASSAVNGMISEAAKEVEDTFQDGDTSKKVKQHLQNLQGLGVLFGSDGFQQSGCAAPTIYLLVIDTAGKTVDGVELTPCDES
jgi:hypothetical protein